jgi:hypothetical protein
MKKSVVFLIAGLFLTSFQSREFSGTTIDFSFNQLSKEPVSSVVKSYTLIPLETNENSYLSRIQKVQVADQRIFVLNSGSVMKRNVLQFSDQGKYLGKLDAQGRGLQEYQSMSDFDIHPVKKQISVLDPGLKKIKNYDFDSKYIDEQSFSSWAKEFKYFTSVNTVFTVLSTKGSRFSDSGENFDIEVYGDNHKLLYSALPFKEAVSIGAGNPASMFRIGNTVSYRQTNTNLVYSIEPGGIRQKYELKFPYPVMPGKELENAFLKGKQIFDQYVYMINYFETEHMILIRYTHDRKPYWGIYDKRSGRSVLFKGEEDPACKCDVMSGIVGTWEKGFILEADYSKITRMLEKLDPKRTKCLNPELFSTADKLDMTSNPVLVFIEFVL